MQNSLVYALSCLLLLTVGPTTAEPVPDSLWDNLCTPGYPSTTERAKWTCNMGNTAECNVVDTLAYRYVADGETGKVAYLPVGYTPKAETTLVSPTTVKAIGALNKDGRPLYYTDESNTSWQVLTAYGDPYYIPLASIKQIVTFPAGYHDYPPSPDPPLDPIPDPPIDSRVEFERSARDLNVVDLLILLIFCCFIV